MSYGWEGNRRFDVAAVLPRVATTFSSHCSCANSNVNILNHIQLRSRDLARKGSVTKGRLRGGAAAGDGVADVVEAGLNHSRRRRFI